MEAKKQYTNNVVEFKMKRQYSNEVVEFVGKYYYAFCVIIMGIICFNTIYKLGDVPIIHYDEARHGASAYEMLKNKEAIVNTFNYSTDYWNLKPPLSFWMIMVGYKILGFNVYGVRFYSIVSTILTIIIIMNFVKHKHGKIEAVISGLVLSTTGPLIVYHCYRSGDSDALYILLFTSAMLSMMLIGENVKFLYLAGFSAALAFLTKSWHGFNIVIIGAIYIFASGTFSKLKLKEWIVFILSYVSPILLWAILRFQKDGLVFFREMIQYDLLKRSSQAIEGHIGGVWYYFYSVLVNYWHWIALLALVIVYYIKFKKVHYSKETKKYILAIALWIVVPFIVYTKAKTKIEWYIYPIYPALAIAVGVILSKLIKEKDIKDYLKVVLICVIFISVISSELLIYRNISVVGQDKIENTFKEMKKMKVMDSYKGYTIYTQDGCEAEKGIWEQGHIFAAELYGDFIPVDGGFEAFLQDKSNKALILAPAVDSTEKIIGKYNLKVIFKQNDKYIISLN